MTSTISTTRQKQTVFNNGFQVTFFSGKWIILNNSGILHPSKFETEEEAIAQAKRMFPNL